MNLFAKFVIAGCSLYGISFLYTLYRYLIKSRKQNFKSKHVFITGGSAGLGKSLAKKLYDSGAFVTIVARDESKLKAVCEELSASPAGKVQYFSFDMCDPSSAAVTALVDKAEEAFGLVDYLFCNAGSSLPYLFLEAEPESFKKMMDVNYLGYAKLSQPVAKRMARRGSGAIVYVASILGVMTCPGYSPYSPSKHAVKALADIVQLELQPHGVQVHLYLPGTILSPGYEEENKIKSEVTKRIEGSASAVSADEAADILLRGMARGDYMITTEMLFEFVMPAAVGSARRENFWFDLAWAPVSVLLNWAVYFIAWKEMKK